MDMIEYYKEWQQSNENTYFSTKLKKIKELMPENKKILDYGCGDGTITQALAEKNTVIGLDISKEAIQISKGKKLDCRLIPPNERIKFKKNEFDYVFMLETIEHIFDTEFILGELNRVLKKDGFLIVTIPNVAQLSNRIRFLFDLKLHYVETKIESGHIRFFTKNSLKDLLEKNGFKVEKITASYVHLPGLGQSSLLANIFPGLGTELIIKAGKKYKLKKEDSQYKMALEGN